MKKPKKKEVYSLTNQEATNQEAIEILRDFYDLSDDTKNLTALLLAIKVLKAIPISREGLEKILLPLQKGASGFSDYQQGHTDGTNQTIQSCINALLRYYE